MTCNGTIKETLKVEIVRLKNISSDFSSPKSSELMFILCLN